jgi:hypothetical protein
LTRLALVSTVLALAVAATSAGSSGAPRRVECGVERWAVKTLWDRPRLLPVRPTTIAALTALRAPSNLPATRLPLERRVYRVTAKVTLVRHEADDDFHLVLRDSTGHHMIAESPLPGCATGATRLRRRQMAQARRAVRLTIERRAAIAWPGQGESFTGCGCRGRAERRHRPEARSGERSQRAGRDVAVRSLPSAALV